ncbi:MAG TPA: STAS domain-containing protein [Ignavibacteriaceae bacterium]|nr:STAS domain-containing protein [Ignavibacteriaceae bacterium]
MIIFIFTEEYESNFSINQTEFFMMEEDYIRKFVENVLIEKINFVRATFKEASIFRDRIYEVISMKQYKIVIDLTRCQFIDSTFLGALVMILKRVTERGGELKLVIPNTEAFKIMDTMGLYRVFNIYNTESEAVNSFSA